MEKVTVRDAASLNVLAAVLFFLVAGVWAVDAALRTSNAFSLPPLPHSVAETMYKVGRFDLLRDTAVNCEKSIDRLATSTSRAQANADWMTALIAFGAVGMLVFNAWFLRKVRRDMDALRSNSPMQPTSQELPAAD